MRRTCLIVVLASMGTAFSAAPLAAQTWPGRHHYYPGYYNGYGYGFGMIYNLGGAGNTGRYIAASQRLASQQIAAQQAAAMQSSIRDAMTASALQRSTQIYDQQQTDRDWWLQIQQQQLAERQAQAQLAAASNSPDAATNVIQWPSLLRRPQFAEQRKQIETPYRRGSKGLSTPSAGDYDDMIEAARQMKLILKGMTVGVSAQDYLDAQAFLDQLAAEARSRVEKPVPKK